MYDAFMAIAPVYNFELTRMSGDTDDETYVTNLQTLIDRGDVDGFIIETTNSVQNAVLDMLEKSGIPYINLFTEYYDSEGRVVTPTVGLPQYQSGYDPEVLQPTITKVLGRCGHERDWSDHNRLLRFACAE